MMNGPERSVRGTVRAGLGVVALLALGGCTSPAPDEPTSAVPSGTASPDGADPGAAASQPPESSVQPVLVHAPIGTRQVEFQVGPLYDEGAASILPIVATDVTADPSGDPVRIGALWLAPTSIGAAGVRLVDPGTRTVQETAGEDRSLHTSGLLELSATPTDMYVVFGPQSAASIDVMLPMAGYAPDVPVRAAAEAPPDVLAALEELVPDPVAVSSNVGELDSFAVSVDGSSDTLVTAEDIEVNISADVLFGSDEAVLSDAADAALRHAVGEFDAYPGGSLRIVGHTDDVDTEAYNQELSERRAQAVADRFADLADLDRYVVDVAGRGESEPRVSGTGDTERALNRRVEVVFTPDGQAGRQEAPEQAGGASAVSDGPTAAGPEGVVLDLDGAQVRVRLAEVERRADLLVGQVEITHVSGDVGSVGPRLAAQGAMSYRGSFDPGLQYAPTNLTLRSGGQWFFPLDYVRPADASVRPLTELNMSPALPGGGTYVATVVWPDVTRGETGLVTVDVHNPREEEAYRSLRPPFRLTDVPVRAAMKAW